MIKKDKEVCNNGDIEYHNYKKAFTLAEVLITLGIIGVVAALTMPTVIQNYKKKQAVTQLKATYSILAQAFEHAQADYGDVSNWGLDEIKGTTSGEREMVTKFVETYFVPYIKPVKNYKIAYLWQIGYGSVYCLNGGKDNISSNMARYTIILSNGAIVAFSIDGHCYGEEGTNENGNWYCTDFRNTNIYIVVDINGKKHPNTLGKDVFVMSVNSSTNKFEFYNYGGYASDRAWLLNACSKNSTVENRHCGRLIQLDGWKINYDW